MQHRLFLSIAAAFALATAPLGAQNTPTAAEDRLAPLKEQAEQGDLHATQQLYMRYAIAGETEEARAWAARYNEQLAALAEGGNTKAMMQLGSRYLSGGDYTPINLEKAVTWFSRAAEAGEAPAAYMLGEIYTRQGNPLMGNKAYAQAYGIYTQKLAADPENLDALYWLGYMEQNGIGVERNTESGIAKLTQAADKGSAWAATQLFKTYVKGIGVPKDEAKAIDLARSIADEQQDALMAYVTASAYLHGKGVAKDEALGEKYLDQAVRGNIPDAVFMKASRLDAAGKRAEALPLYNQAASMQQREALVKLGTLMLHGAEGVEKDEARGLSMLELAGNRLGSPLAAWELARYYSDAHEQDIADSWYVTASQGGLVESFARRGLLHLIPGSCVTWSPTQTYQWWLAGKKAGDPTCTLYLNLFYYAFIPLLLLLVFGVPIYLSRKMRRRLAKELREEAEKE